MRFARATLTFIAVWCASSPAVHAQDAAGIPPPYMAVVDGTATLDREDVVEPATRGVPLVPGDRVRTERGRVELVFPDGSALDLDQYSTIEFEGPTLLRMTSGRMILFAAGASNPASAVQFQIDTPAASAQTDGPGEYHVSIEGRPSNPQTEMAIVRGRGALVTEVGTTPLRSRERSTAWDNAPPSRPQLFDSAREDAFDRWATAQRDDERPGPGSRSAQYLPTDMRMYGGELDRYGSWNYEAPYGYVWYPTVAPEWRPYSDGYWAPVPTYGWTWIGADVWSWPTHHYGRWGYARSRWFWIPDRRWGPAWVSWGDAPGYVSWCPLGFDNRPVFGLSVSVGSGYRGLNGWTVVSRDHFGGHRPVRQFAVAPRSLPANIRFVAQRSAPVAAPRAIARRGFENRGQFAGNRRQFPNVVGRAADSQQHTVPRREVYGDRPGEGQSVRPDRPTSITRSPQAVSRQPQTNRQGQPNGQPQRSEPRSGDRPGALSRQASAPPMAPATPQQRQTGAVRRVDPIRPIQPAQRETPAPALSRRSAGPISSPRPTPPPAVTTPPQQASPRVERRQTMPQVERPQAPPREQRSTPPRQERQSNDGRSRGHENQQPSPNRQDNGDKGGANGNGHHRR